MKLRTLFVINAVIAGVFGFLFFLIPWQVLKFYGVETDPQINYMAQLFGAAVFGLAVVSWLSRNSGPSSARKAIVLAFFITNCMGFIMALINQLNQVINSFGWSTVAIYFLLAISFGYFQFRKSKE